MHQYFYTFAMGELHLPFFKFKEFLCPIRHIIIARIRRIVSRHVRFCRVSRIQRSAPQLGHQQQCNVRRRKLHFADIL